jgi:hypothetical protein
MFVTLLSNSVHPTPVYLKQSWSLNLILEIWKVITINVNYYNLINWTSWHGITF